jgi:hypothetical protein
LIPKKIEEKIASWESEAKRMQPKLPDDDRVWSAWWNMIQSFKNTMKWTSKLVSDSLKVIFFFHQNFA